MNIINGEEAKLLFVTNLSQNCSDKQRMDVFKLYICLYKNAVPLRHLLLLTHCNLQLQKRHYLNKPLGLFHLHKAALQPVVSKTAFHRSATEIFPS